MLFPAPRDRELRPPAPPENREEPIPAVPPVIESEPEAGGGEEELPGDLSGEPGFSPA